MLTSRRSRLKYDFSTDFFRPDGHVIFSDLASARAFAGRMSTVRAEPLPAADLYALSLLDEAYHLLLQHFYGRHTGLLSAANIEVKSSLGQDYDLTLNEFTEEFPPLSVMGGETTAEAYLAEYEPPLDQPGRGPHLAALEEILLVNNSNKNPAIKRYGDLFDESALYDSSYLDLLRSVTAYLSRSAAGQTGVAGGETLMEILAAPIKDSPDSLEGQLRFVVEKWRHILGETFAVRILRGLDYLREEAIRKQLAAIDSHKVETQVPTFGGSEYAEYERYSLDKEWMPRLVLLAKNTYVWLGQLSKKYQRDISTLDQIPDEELDLFAARGFTGLWLIGLWERSLASQRIKQRMGQADAVASAYSLDSYDIARDLGGWDALNNLRSRAWSRGIRLSADMVPNHMGIDSTWVVEHPDWFLATPTPPYPSYTFNSENLSDDSRAEIVLEDHYYDHSDASVVFKLHNRQSDETKYIYHGNDGTSFPWNDTAQLDYTNPQVREAIIQVILHVARNFPVIRFDAAMTLAKKHIQRLWFPEPGAGGAIPSRSQFGMTKSEFNEKVPEEFWREVVDRVAAEVPDTLLLAEAFWLMEGYFVRTLGMHRVYNSAFMHMLRDEENAKYRMAIKNTLEFDPQILKRYVNFMNNPDEKSAVEQFGKGDKYFGICTLLSTLPGLPMYGHGQVEGYSEKYGMEFRRAKWDETPDDGLIRGHDWRIFPLLHHRYLFADVEQFLLYDFYTASGGVNENVFALSNRFDEERGLVIYHNKFADTRGWIKSSAAFIDKSSGRTLRRNIAEGMGFPRTGNAIFKDHVSGLEYIRSCREIWEKGLYLELGAYQCHAFMDWRFVDDSDWDGIREELNGARVDSLQARWSEKFNVTQAVGSEAKAPAKKRVRRTMSAKAVIKTKAGAKAAKKKVSAGKGKVKQTLPKAKGAPAKKPVLTHGKTRASVKASIKKAPTTKKMKTKPVPKKGKSPTPKAAVKKRK